MRLPHIPRAEELDIALIGIPYDGGTTYRPGPRFGPRHVRDQSAIIRPWNPVLSVNPFEKHRIADYGDLSINPLSIDDTFRRITSQLAEVLRAGARTACVGGDHSILLPILRSIHQRFGPVGLIQFDAHNDTWGGYFGSPHSHGTPVRRAIEEGLLAGNDVLQIGLRGQVYSKDDFEFGKQHGFRVVTSEEFHRRGLPADRSPFQEAGTKAGLCDPRHRCRRSGVRAGDGHASSWWSLECADSGTGAQPARTEHRRLRSGRGVAALRHGRDYVAAGCESSVRIALRDVTMSLSETQ